MPTYEYRCENGHTFEVMQSMADEPVSVCETCGEPVQRVFHAVAVHFKGSGFYSTDYGKKGAGAAEKDEKTEKAAEKAAEKASEKASDKDAKKDATDKAGGSSTEKTSSGSDGKTKSGD